MGIKMDVAAEQYGLKFSKPKIVMTKFGEREVCNAEPTEEFWSAWREKKDELKRAGFGVSKSFDDGKWQVSLWAQTMSREDRLAASDASRATDAAVNVPVPEGMELMPFQRAGIAYALKREGTLIGDEMGLGKTIQAIGFANSISARGILVVAPASLLLNWRNEIKRWQTLDLPIFVIRPGKVFTGKTEGWYIINYDIVSRYEAQLKATPWDLAVFDECQYMKTRSAQRTLTLLGGTRKDKTTKERVKVDPVPAARKLMLTGTPIMNRPAELFPILHHLDPKRWSTWSGFAKRYCGGVMTRNGFDASGASNLDELNARLRETVMVRRLKADVLTELPAKRRQIVTLDVDDESVAAIVRREVEVFERTEAAIAAASAEMQRAEAEGDEVKYKDAVAKLKAAQGIAFTEMALVRHETAVAKLPTVIEHLKQTTGKVLVFAWHKDVVDGICEAMRDEGVVSITGETQNEKRQPIVEQFQKDENIRFFVGNIKAAGVGLTLTASSHVVFAELDWTPSSVSQAEDRAHRIGQRESVLVQHIVLDGSLDAKMAKLIVQKQKIIDNALDAKVAISEPEVTDMPLVPLERPAPTEKQPVAFNERRAKLDAIAATLTPDQIEAIHEALRTLAAMDTDRARSLNGMGFSKLDTMFGCELAERTRLTPRQAAAGMKLARKYRRQYPTELYGRIFGEEELQEAS